jgi:hypothetical protein
LQVENEYGYYEGAYGEGGKRYAAWAAQMAVSQNTGVPWIMCQQFDAPPSVVRVYNIPKSRYLKNWLNGTAGYKLVHYYT